jgi:hypothetical protein
MSAGDNIMLRRAAETALAVADLCICPMQVFRLAREIAPFVIVVPDCDCPMCNGLMAHRVSFYIAAHPELVDGFHRPGASAMHGPGEKRDDLLIGPFC